MNLLYVVKELTSIFNDTCKRKFAFEFRILTFWGLYTLKIIRPVTEEGLWISSHDRKRFKVVFRQIEGGDKNKMFSPDSKDDSSAKSV